MLKQGSAGLVALALLLLAAGEARALDDSKYPDWSGGWGRVGGGAFDGSQGVGGATPAGVDPKSLQEHPPLTPEYQARWDAMKEAQTKGAVSNNPVERCLPPGMPRTMIVIDPMEIIITPKTTYMMISYMMEQRRIYTDGRDWPKEAEPSFSGYSIGKWQDTQGTGTYDTLATETRSLKGPRAYDPSGIPFHDDNETVVKEVLTRDKSNPQRLRNDITVFDHALTQPWTVTRYYQHIANPAWHEYVCTENNNWVQIGNQSYYLSPDGMLMPTAKGQPAPDLRFFNQPAK
jgi:hypothetical protein